MFGKLICWWSGHKRGKRVEVADWDHTADDLSSKFVLQCPRCGAQWPIRSKK